MVLYFYSKNASDKTSINVYTWGEFISTGADGEFDVNAEFTRETGIEVNCSTFQSNEEMYAKLAGGGTDYDVLMPSDYMISKMIKNKMLAKLNFDNIPNYALVNKEYKNLNFDPENEYSVPYMWGFLGIFYNKKYIKEKISWNSLWNDQYKGKILMLDNSRDAFCISLIRLGLSVNSAAEEDWRKAANELKIQKPLVQGYIMDQIFDKLKKEEAYIAPYYFGNSMPHIFLENSEIEFSVPEEGTNKFIDSMCIPEESKKKDKAEKYINFMCQKAVAVANAKTCGYIPAQIESENEILEGKFLEIKNAQIYTGLPDKINTLSDDLWVDIKSGEKRIFFENIILTIMFIVLIVLYFYPLILKLFKKIIK